MAATGRTGLSHSGSRLLKRGTLPSAAQKTDDCLSRPGTISLPSHHHVRLGLDAQLHQCWAKYSAVPSEANRYQLVRLERLLQEI